ncbi:tRNA (N(6)-L-threonylcarbamoyladenosine(37)-C(2))-methylthiotransferase MtaB [Candidatus Magnetobacterium casense]|uniref:tRNA (N(6)-L-threonylcarbamoyladenosine(37)-C(2))-methylthiotransferase MtaB n=1 Tax=Candidatus Magnetobacterium casense TaxID=1455061 RepID=A0ABS6S0W7_9BACT|nr:tRNA (N(6)-L-threonylcarbamoyladenosine(37)-C(2))-methylthiotransferase MtaB [Candidatus Magnetobacterium casensis]MBV6342456.1 tRNA (N(6)-L-threonylcarbamoyladenosine(37)-C(2))-methylthiotransferase MtaB [Candidatus Magnetobacterium casensis]
MRFCILTLGCKANQAESSAIEGQFLKQSHVPVTVNERPDVCIINTCSVTAKSDYQSRQIIRRAIKAGSKVFATGCYSELNRDALRAISEDITVIGNKDKLLHFSDAAFAEAKTVVPVVVNSGRSRALLKIQDGCNAHCSYCIIPQSRGRSTSRPVADIIDEVRTLVTEGYNEVVLTGIHIGYYGLDLVPQTMLADLVESILDNTAGIKVRLTSLEVSEFTGKLLGLLRHQRLCRHVHIPLQSGDDQILGDMHRGYRTDDFKRLLLDIHGDIDNAAIGTDVIVGYPGEDDASFGRTYEFLAGLPLTYMHVFPFSPRRGTRAFALPAQVDEQTKKQRALLLRQLSGRKKAAFMAGQVGRILPAIVEKPDGDICQATTDNYLKVEFLASGGDAVVAERGLVDIEITGVKDGSLQGAQATEKSP